MSKARTEDMERRAARNRAARLQRKADGPRECEECGATQNIETHHRDGNPFNNSRDNLMELCKQCHAELHLEYGTWGKNRQRDNTFLANKVALRLKHLPSQTPLYVLDAFAGNGVIWRAVEEATNTTIRRLGIDNKTTAKGATLIGDNVKFLRAMNLSQFNVIDLDAYGTPFRQLEALWGKTGRCAVFVTFIQTNEGTLHKGLLRSLGYSDRMVRKCPTLFSRHGFKKFKHYLANNGVKRIWHRSSFRKHYIFFEMGQDHGGDL